MQAFLKENTAKIAKIKLPLPVELRIPINAGRITGVKGRKPQTVGGFSAAIPNEDSVKLTEWLNYKADRADLTSFVVTTGNQTVAGNKTFSGNVSVGDLTVTGTTITASAATDIDFSAATTLNAAALPVFADDTAAAALAAGDIYQTATGELRIKL